MAYNLIFYFSDQQRWDTCGCYGQPLDITPNLDALAAEGVRFDNAFSPQPVCGPCRALFQTGKFDAFAAEMTAAAMAWRPCHCAHCSGGMNPRLTSTCVPSVSCKGVSTQ